MRSSVGATVSRRPSACLIVMLAYATSGRACTAAAVMLARVSSRSAGVSASLSWRLSSTNSLPVMQSRYPEIAVA
jgi:hypothetical protein